ncbi:MAG: MMPL family transporter [Epulopiscium sp.]|nr:MMPL family transporter [Candidatus Epulonipiscium sp.]
MSSFGRWIGRHRVTVLIVSLLLLIPSVIGLKRTKINYDILTYLPEELESVAGQKLLNEHFSNAGITMLIVENMAPKDILSLKEKIGKIQGVEKVIWTSDLFDITVPKEMLPDTIKNFFYQENSTLLFIQMSESSATETTQNAIEQIRSLLDDQSYLSGVSAIIKDTITLSRRDTPFYVAIAVILATIVLALTLESTFVPFIFLASIGIAILYNMGTNIIFKEISYITKSLAAVLQLGVTMDYSIFLLHRYEEELTRFDDRIDAMGEAIAKTASSAAGAALTTIAGFLALAFMKLEIGRDIGFVMAKGVFIGIICTLTVLPAMILIFDKVIHRFHHGTVLPSFEKTSSFVTKHYAWFAILFVLLFIPAFYGQQNVEVYYNLDESLPKDMPSIIALNKLKEEYHMMTTHMIGLPTEIPSYQIQELLKEIDDIPGIEGSIGFDKFAGVALPEKFIPADLISSFASDDYKLILVNSNYKASTDEGSQQIELLNHAIKKYHKDSFITGEGVLSKDLIEISDIDFKRVNIISILAIFIILFLLFTSFSIPILLVTTIELAIFINMGIPYYTNTAIPFIASIVIGSIQLGATVDYAILLTNRFKEELNEGHDKVEAMGIALQSSTKSIVTSALTFFGSTIGVAIISEMSIVSSLTLMIARGSLISMIAILFILPSLLIVFESFIASTSFYWRKKETIVERSHLS